MVSALLVVGIALIGVTVYTVMVTQQKQAPQTPDHDSKTPNVPPAAAATTPPSTNPFIHSSQPAVIDDQPQAHDGSLYTQDEIDNLNSLSVHALQDELDDDLYFLGVHQTPKLINDRRSGHLWGEIIADAQFQSFEGNTVQDRMKMNKRIREIAMTSQSEEFVRERLQTNAFHAKGYIPQLSDQGHIQLYNYFDVADHKNEGLWDDYNGHMRYS